MILRIDLFQPFAQYRNPFTFIYAQSYPLPPKSTIIGMLNNLLEKFELEKDLKITISGTYKSCFYHYSSFIKGDSIDFEKGFLNVTQKKSHLPLFLSQRTPLYQQELKDVDITLFIKGDVDILNLIRERIEHPKKVLSLGRAHDIIFIKSIKIINESDIKKEEISDTIEIVGKNVLIPSRYFDENNLSLSKSLPFFMPSKIDYKTEKGEYLYSVFFTPRKGVRRKSTFEKVYYLEEGRHIIEEGKKVHIEFYEERNKNAELRIPLFWW